MARSVARIVGILTVGFMLHLPGVAGATDELILSDVRIVGTDQLSSADVIRGLHLRVGEKTSRQELLRSCDRLIQLRIFQSARCAYAVRGHRIAMTVFVKPAGMPVVFDNFVWTTRPELLASLKREIPLFVPTLPESSGITNDIIRVLQEVVNERGINAPVRYDGHYWIIRGMHVFYVEGISAPVNGFQIEGANAPRAEEVVKFSSFYTKESFSAARLTWVARWAIRDFYESRGYLHAVSAEPIIQFLGEKDGAFPVRVILPILAGDVYVFDEVNFEGLARAHSALLLSKWGLERGEPYDKPYVDDFISKEILNAPWAMRSKDTSDTSGVALTCSKIDEASKRVSVTITVEVPRKSYRFGAGCSESFPQRLHAPEGGA